MKNNSIYIDHKNVKQMEWWNKVASKLVSVRHYATIVETATGKPVGTILQIGGLFKNYVIKSNLRFIKNPVTMRIKD